MVLTLICSATDRTMRAVLGIAATLRIAAESPFGWPDGVQFGPVKRRPMADFVHHNRWEGDKRGADA